MLISARARGYLCNLIHVSLFRIPIHEKQEKGKGKWGSELYMEQGQLCKHIECVEGKGFFCKKNLHNSCTTK